MVRHATAGEQKDRRVELVVAGVIAGVAGVASLGLALLGVVMDRLATRPSPLAAWSGAALSVVLGAGLVWLGLGVGGGRRWAVAVARAVAVVWLVTGVVGVVLGVLSVPALAGSSAAAGGLATVIVTLVLGAVLFVGGVMLPAAMLWLLARSGIEATLRRLDPGPSWVDDCSRPRLTLAVVWGLLAVSAIGMGAYGFVLPVGGIVFAGAAGAVGWLLILIASAVLAWLTATGARGWWPLGLAATLLAAAFTTLTFVLVDPATIAAHIPGENGAMLRPLAASTSRLSATLFNVAGWATLLAVVVRAGGRSGVVSRVISSSSQRHDDTKKHTRRSR